MNDCIKRVWGASPGANAKYREAKADYIQVQTIIHDLARQSMQVPQRQRSESEIKKHARYTSTSF